MLLLVAPVVLWAKHGTAITLKDILRAGMPPGVSVLFGAAFALGAEWLMRGAGSALLRLTVVSAVLFGVYGSVLLFAMGQKQTYLELFQATGLLRKRRPAS
jgi:hypothetical protein